MSRWQWLRHDWHRWMQRAHHARQLHHRREAHRHMRAAQWVIRDALGVDQ